MTTGTNDLKIQEQARYELQRAQLVIASDPEAALRHLEEAKTLDPRNLDVVTSMGLVQIRLGKYIDAVNTLNRVLQFSENPSAGVLATLALAHRKLRHLDEAKAFALRGLTTDPGNRVAREVLGDVLMAQADWRQALSELSRLTGTGVPVDAVARISMKCGWCRLRLNEYQKALDLASILIENGYESPAILALFDEAEAKVKGSIEEGLKNESIWIRIFLRLLNKPIFNLYMHSSRGMDDLRRMNLEQSEKLEDAHAQSEEYRRRADEAARESKTDSLTGLPNRRCLKDDYEPKLVPGTSWGVVAMDLDHFKWVNDLHGHSAGDDALRKTAAIGGQVFRHPEGNFFRIGGEEFVALVCGKPAEVAALAEKFRLELESRAAAELAEAGLTLMQVDQQSGRHIPRKLTASIGIAMFPDDFSEFQTLLQAADVASYKAKDGGRNRVVIYKKGMVGKDGKSPEESIAADLFAFTPEVQA